MTILAAVGGQHERDRVVEVGHDLATTYGDELVVLHVMEQEQFEELQHSSEVSGPVVVPGVDEASGLAYVESGQSSEEYNLENAISDAENVARECVARTLDDERGGAISFEARVGNPATEIEKVADDVDARYIVVGGRKRSPTGKAIFGSVSQSVILNSDRPVVTITRGEK